MDSENLTDAFLTRLWARLLAGEGFFVRGQLEARRGKVFDTVKQTLREEKLCLTRID